MYLPLCWVVDWLNIICIEWSIKIDQLINLDTWVVTVIVFVVSSDNNPTISSWTWPFSLGCVTCNFCSIIVDPYSFIITGSHVVTYNMCPSGWSGVWCYKLSFWWKDKKPEKKTIIMKYSSNNKDSELCEVVLKFLDVLMLNDLSLNSAFWRSFS